MEVGVAGRRRCTGPIPGRHASRRGWRSVESRCDALVTTRRPGMGRMVPSGRQGGAQARRHDHGHGHHHDQRRVGAWQPRGDRLANTWQPPGDRLASAPDAARSAAGAAGPAALAPGLQALQPGPVRHELQPLLQVTLQLGRGVVGRILAGVFGAQRRHQRHQLRPPPGSRLVDMQRKRQIGQHFMPTRTAAASSTAGSATRAHQRSGFIPD